MLTFSLIAVASVSTVAYVVCRWLDHRASVYAAEKREQAWRRADAIITANAQRRERLAKILAR